MVFWSKKTIDKFLGEIMEKKFLALLATIIFSNAFAEQTAPVEGFARKFGTTEPIVGATITVLETDEKLKTDKNGNFGPIQYPVGKDITLVFEKIGYRTTQTATVTVPPEGLVSPYNKMTFQAVDHFTFLLFAGAVGEILDETKCHFVATVTSFHKTMDDLPQGEENATVTMMPAPSKKPYYLDIFKDGPLKDYTNPFSKGLTATSKDGGVIFANLEPSNMPYYFTANKSGMRFNTVKFLCRKGMFINMSPPQGPSVQL